MDDYFTKHQPSSHRNKLRPIYLHTKHSPSSLQGCIEFLAMHMPKFKRLIRLVGALAAYTTPNSPRIVCHGQGDVSAPTASQARYKRRNNIDSR